ncbi:hypothetical protein GGI20_001439 [Coemansia sp. BCRC 34301]|nr:hypothetical protein GGI20_001439 [Coemansia sp. BCRC 34301]
MSHSDWETDSEYRQFRPGRYAMRQLGRSVSRRTKLLLQQQPSHDDQQPQPSGSYRRGPPLPSGIHRRSVSFDNMEMFPDSVRRSSTEPGVSTVATSPSIGIPTASTWNSGSAGTRSGKQLQTRGGSRQAWLAGLAHPLSTAIDSTQAATVVGPHTGTRESFSGAAQLDASTHMTNSPRSLLDGSDPFQNRHLWISEEDLVLEAQEAPVAQVTFQAVQIAPSAPVGSERAAGGARKLGSIARVISTLSRKLHGMRSQRSASQPATPAEVRRSILHSARQNMIHVPSDPAHDFYRFIVNPADPVSDRESSAPDSPTISRHASSSHRRRHHCDSAVAASTSLPPVGPASPVFSSESLDRLYESISRIPLAPPASTSSHRRSASVGAAIDNRASEPHVFLTNQGHNGSVSELVLAKLASEFVDNVRVSTRLATGLSAESSYGTFVRFHNSGELSGIFAADHTCSQQPAMVMMQQGSASAEALSRPRTEETVPARYARNHDNVSRFVEEVRAVQQDSARRKVDALEQRQVLDNSQALMDAAMHIYERQQKHIAAEAEARRRRKSKDHVPRRRTTVFGMFCAPTIASTSLSSSQESIAVEVVNGTNRKTQVRRSQSLPRISNDQQISDSDGRQWTQEDLHVSWHRRSDQRQAANQQPERISYPLQAQTQAARVVSTATPRTRSGFLAGVLGILTSSGNNNNSRKSNAVEADALPSTEKPQLLLPAPNVDVCVPAESLSEEICAGIAHSAQDATLSSTGRRMYSEVLQSLRDPTDSAASADQHKHSVRFEQRPAAGPPPRTSSVAMDTITAAKHRPSAASPRRMPQSMPHSRAMSSDGSLADMLASADCSERFGAFHMQDLPGLESYAGTPLPANARLRRLEDEVLYGACRPATAESLGPRAMLASFETPVSEAGTGRTQILDFAEADIRSPASVVATQLQRRPSARPEIRDVRGILWADTNPTSTAAASADLSADTPATGSKTLSVAVHPAKTPLLSSKAPNAAVPALDAVGLHDPLVLARLVHTSPDPRSLIYDAASQFGSMRSRPSPEPELPASINVSRIVLRKPRGTCDRPDLVVSDVPALESSRQMSSKNDNESVSPSMPWAGTRTPDELSMLRQSRQFAQATDSEALAQASVQATMSGESPATAAKVLPQKPLRAHSHAQPNAVANGKKSERPISLQEYVEQQKIGVHHRSTPTGHEQLNFRVSLLERAPPEYRRKTRSVSLPSPHSGMPVLPADILQSRPSPDRPIYIPRPAAHQRTKSFYDSPPLVQALLLLPPPEWPNTASGQSQEQSLAEEELAERALFSHLLGDGAALTSPDLKVARRQSSAQPSVQTAPLLFDPEVDTGENGVPDSVLRAYLAGDLTAIERFFEHIMRITAPSSVYDGEVSEDGDWTFGLEGPPPEVLAQREAARKEFTNASREVPDMVDASAEASRVATSSANLQQTAPAVSKPIMSNSALPVAQMSLSQSDPQLLASVGDGAIALAELLPQPSLSPATEETPAVYDDGGSGKAVANEASVSNDASNAPMPVRKIAVAKSQVARRKREGLHNSSGQSSSTNSADLSGHNCKSNTSASMTNSQRLPDDDSRAQHSDGPVSPWDDIDIVAAPSQITGARNLARFATSQPPPPPPPPSPPPAGATVSVPYDKIAACISPGRARSRNRRQSESGARSTIIPSQFLPNDRRDERPMLMARLRVLESMIHKAAMEEARLQPPAVLRKSRLVEDVESIASIYSSSMEIDYERVYQELNNSQRHRADSRRKSADPEVLRRSSESSRQQQGLSYNQARNLGSGQAPHGTGRGEVLARLKQGSQARAMSPLRASILGRSHAAPIYKPGERSAGANTGGVANTSLLLSEMSEVAYSARSDGSIRIDIVNEGSAPSLSAADTSHLGRALAYQSSSRFQRTAKLLGL